MKLTEFTKDVLHHRKAVRGLEREGYAQIDLRLELDQMGLWGQTITEVRIGPDGESVFIKTSEKDEYREAREFGEECERDEAV